MAVRLGRQRFSPTGVEGPSLEPCQLQGDDAGLLSSWTA